MFFRRAAPRICYGMRPGGWGAPWRRGMAGRADIPIHRWRCGPFFPWRGMWGFPHPLRSLGRMERDFDDMWRAMNAMWPPRMRERYSPGETTKQPELQVNYDDKTFDVRVNVRAYSSEELQVKVESDSLVVSGRAEERADEHGIVSSQFTRRIRIPEDVDPDTIKCELTGDGFLDIQARIRGVPLTPDRVINIEKPPPSGGEGGASVDK